MDTRRVHRLTFHSHPNRLLRQDQRVNPSTALARVLVDELVRCGVREAVLARAVTGSLAVGAVTPDPDLLAHLAAPPDRRAWWLDRLRRCHAVLTTARS